MSRKRFHEIDDRDHFIPVELISYSNAACHVKILTKSGDKNLVVPYIYQLERPIEPQKVTIPKFVAEWVEECKRNSLSLGQAIEFVNGRTQPELFNWFWDVGFRDRQLLFARAWLDGYEIEQEKLYIVEVPNPNRKGNNRIFLQRDSNTGKILLCKGNFNPEKNKTLWLTEDEIKQDFAWAWNEKFAKEVE